jgi:hypothetical protein
LFVAGAQARSEVVQAVGNVLAVVELDGLNRVRVVTVDEVELTTVDEQFVDAGGFSLGY